MKIAHIVSTFPPYRGGIGNAAYHMSWELARLGHQVTVFTTAVFSSPEIDESLPFKVKRLRPWLYYGNAAFVPQLIWKLHDFDVVHLHYPFFGGAEMLYLRNSLKPINTIVQYHMDVVGEGVFKKFFKLHSTVIMPRILDNANIIIVTSMDYARQSKIQDLLMTKSGKLIEIPLGVNPELFKPRIRSQELLKKYNLQNKKIILFVGALDRAHYFKGVNYLIKAFQLIASNDEYRLLIVGAGNLKKTYESLATNFGLERKIIFAENVSNDVLPLHYNLADVFVLPSIDSSEAFGIVVLEAMASGVPVVASDLPGVRSVVSKNVTGVLTKPKHIASLAKHLHFFLKNPHIGHAYGAAGRNKVLEKYTWEIVGKELEKVYEDHLA